jgi:hypothetical protein
MGMVRYWLHTDSYEVQCPTCHQCVPVTAAHFDGLEPLPRHSRWSPSWTQQSYAHWPTHLQRRWILRGMVRLEAWSRWLTRRYEPACDDETARVYRDWLPSGFGHVGPR